MLSKECRLVRREIDELELGERPTERASAHLSICVGCREFRAERTELRRLVGSFEPVAVPADFEMRLRARIARDESPAQRQPFFAPLLRTPALAAAALFVVISGTVVWVAQRNDDPSAPVARIQQTVPAATTPSKPATTNKVAENSTESNPGVDVVENAGTGSNKRIRPVRGPRTADYGVAAADPIRQYDQAFVNAPSKPVVFGLEDERGTKRKISLPPVSFGAQSLVDNRVPVSYSGNSRVW